MKLEYKIEEADYLAFQLYTASQAPQIAKKRVNSHIIITAGLGLLGLIMVSVSTDKTFGLFYLILAIVAGFYYPRYFKWRYKKHYLSHIRHSYKQRIGLMVTLLINDDTMVARDKTGESTLLLSEVEGVTETSAHFFLRFTTGVSIIIPKKNEVESKALTALFNQKSIPVSTQLSWRW
jgi:hypothetical protein